MSHAVKGHSKCSLSKMVSQFLTIFFFSTSCCCGCDGYRGWNGCGRCHGCGGCDVVLVVGNPNPTRTLTLTLFILWNVLWLLIISEFLIKRFINWINITDWFLTKVFRLVPRPCQQKTYLHFVHLYILHKQKSPLYTVGMTLLLLIWNYCSSGNLNQLLTNSNTNTCCYKYFCHSWTIQSISERHNNACLTTKDLITNFGRYITCW